MNSIPQAALDSPYLDTIISLVLVYALLSILVSILLEAWNKRTKERGVFLQKVIFRLLDDPLNKNYGYLIYQHPIINTMRKDGNSYPHYIPAEQFANALIDTVADQAVTISYKEELDGTYKKDIDGQNDPLALRLVKGVGAMRDSEFKRLLTNFLDRNRILDAKDADGKAIKAIDLDKLKLELGRWFDDFMDRASGEYKNAQRGKLLFLGLAVAVVLNVDSLHLARTFLLDTHLRDSMVAQAEEIADHYAATKRQLGDSAMMDTGTLIAVIQAQERKAPLDTTQKQLLHVALAEKEFQDQAEEVISRVQAWQLPIGWNPDEAPRSWFNKGTQLVPIPEAFRPADKARLHYYNDRNETWRRWNWLRWAIGVSITTISLSMGAPFWFETLVKLINIRRSGPKPKTTEERSAK